MNKNEEQTSHLAHIAGPILFTAPHSKDVYRGGGPLYDCQKQVHSIEVHTSLLAVDFAHEAMNYVKTKDQTGSFCVWGNKKLNDKDRDPNYLLEQLFSESPFHQTLHQFIANNKETPLFHVDIHGKLDRKHNCQLDVGIMSMIILWPQDQQIVKQIQSYMKQHIDKLFDGLVLGGFDAKCNVFPSLSGYWGGEIKTMTTQAIELGIPSVQFELPRKMRDLFAQNKQLRTGLVKIIAGTYNNVIVPLWNKKVYPLKLKNDLLGKLKFNKFKKEEIGKIRDQLLDESKNAFKIVQS